MRISSGGQISIPAAIRHRWGTTVVVLDDQGDRIVIEPAPEDPVDAARGALREFGPVDLTALRRRAREDERVAEERRRRR